MTRLRFLPYSLAIFVFGWADVFGQLSEGEVYRLVAGDFRAVGAVSEGSSFRVNSTLGQPFLPGAAGDSFVARSGFWDIARPDLLSPVIAVFAPVLLQPVDDAIDLMGEIGFVWSRSPGAASYRFQLARDDRFAQLLRDDAALTDTTVSISGLEHGTTYFWRVGAAPELGEVTFSASFRFTTAVAVSSENLDLPVVFALHQNHPNPFNPTTLIEYDLPESAVVRVELFDATGRLVQTLVHATRAPGRHQIMLDAADLAGGAYLYRITAGEWSATKSMLLLK